MAITPQTEDIAKKFGLESVPESVQRLNQLLSKRDASTEDIAKLISQDKELSARLLRAANPRAESEADYVTTTVEEALQRTGMSSALLLAMSDPLIRAVYRTFATMLKIELKAILPNAIDPFDSEHVLGEVTFAGKATGLVHLRLPKSFIPLLGDRLLGLSPADIADSDTANDVIGELCNMIVGNFKSNLCDAGLNCKLHPPAVRRTDDFVLRVQSGHLAQRLALCAPEVNLLVELHVDPWGD